jgi:hypothetical protein
MPNPKPKYQSKIAADKREAEKKRSLGWCRNLGNAKDLRKGLKHG